MKQRILSVEAVRHLREEAAIRLGKAIFQWLGIRHPIADRLYRRFTNILSV